MHLPLQSPVFRFVDNCPEIVHNANFSLISGDWILAFQASKKAYRKSIPGHCFFQHHFTPFCPPNEGLYGFRGCQCPRPYSSKPLCIASAEDCRHAGG